MKTIIPVFRYNGEKCVNDEALSAATECDLSFIQQEIKSYNEQISLGYNPLTNKQILLLRTGTKISFKKKFWFIPYYKDEVLNRDMYIIRLSDCALLQNHFVGAVQDGFRPQSVPLITAKIITGFQYIELSTWAQVIELTYAHKTKKRRVYAREHYI